MEQSGHRIAPAHINVAQNTTAWSRIQPIIVTTTTCTAHIFFSFTRRHHTNPDAQSTAA